MLTRKQSDRLHQSYVGTEHLLLALLELREGVAYSALQLMQVDLPALQQTLDAKAKAGTAREILPSIPYTPMAKKVLELGSVEATALGHNYFGTEHMLLGMLHGRCGIAGAVLKQHKVVLESTREAVREVLKPQRSENTAPSHSGM